MEKSSWRKFLRGASLQKDIEDIKDLAVRYIKEETVKPIKDLGRYMLYGAIGSIFVGTGTIRVLRVNVELFLKIIHVKTRN